MCQCWCWANGWFCVVATTLGVEVAWKTLLKHRKWDSQSRNKSPMTESLVMHTPLLCFIHALFFYISLISLSLVTDSKLYCWRRRLRKHWPLKVSKRWHCSGDVDSKPYAWTNLLQSKSHNFEDCWLFGVWRMENAMEAPNNTSASIYQVVYS